LSKERGLNKKIDQNQAKKADLGFSFQLATKIYMYLPFFTTV